MSITDIIKLVQPELKSHSISFKDMKPGGELTFYLHIDDKKIFRSDIINQEKLIKMIAYLLY